jgi:hypothetical protein
MTLNILSYCYSSGSTTIIPCNVCPLITPLPPAPHLRHHCLLSLLCLSVVAPPFHWQGRAASCVAVKGQVWFSSAGLGAVDSRMAATPTFHHFDHCPQRSWMLWQLPLGLCAVVPSEPTAGGDINPDEKLVQTLCPCMDQLSPLILLAWRGKLHPQGCPARQCPQNGPDF